MAAPISGKPDLGTTAVYRRLARNSAFLGAGTVASAVFMMLAVVLSARALSPREFGLLVLFQSATMMMATLMSFATQQPVIKLGATALADGDNARLGRIIGLGLLFDAGAAVLATAAAFLFLAFGRGLVALPDDQLGVAALFAASLLFTGYLTSNGIFRLLDRFGLLSLIQTLCAATILVATIALYASGAGFEAYCWAWAIFYAVNGLLPLVISLYLALRARIPISLSTSKMGPGETSTFLAYCWTTWGMATVEAVRTNGDTLLVGAAVSVEGAGIYNVAKQLAGVLRKMNTVYASAMFPEVSALSAHGADNSASQVRRRLMWVSGLIGIAAIAAAALLGRFVLVNLFSDHFEAAYVPLIILTAAAACQLMSHTLSMYVQVYLGPHRLFRLYLLGMAVFLVAVFPLTSLLGIDGTAWAQLLFALALIYLCHWELRTRDLAGNGVAA